MNYEQFMKYEEENKRRKFNMFQDELRKNFINDEASVSKIYTRDKNEHTLKVCSLKSGKYALVNDKDEIIFKSESLHLCKVEWIMAVQDPSFINNIF